eukprot:COSAG06_NODE_4120_length_4550_cov_1.804314_2_plen_158_part_00
MVASHVTHQLGKIGQAEDVAHPVKAGVDDEVNVLLIVCLAGAVLAHWRIAALHADAIVQVATDLEAERVPVVYHLFHVRKLTRVYLRMHAHNWHTLWTTSFGSVQGSCTGLGRLTTGLPSPSCHLQPPALQFGHCGRAGSAVGGLPAEQLQRCQPSS